MTPPLPAAALGALVGLPHESIVPAGLELLNETHGGLGWAVFRVEQGLALPSDPDGMLPPDAGPALQPELALPGAAPRERFLHAAPDLLLRACEPVAREAAEKREALLGESSLAGGRCLVMALPCYEGGRLAAVLCRLQDPSQRGEALPLAALQATGLLRQVASVRAESHRIRSRFGKVAAFVELLGSSAGGLDFAECSRRLANHLRETLGCETVALSLRDWRGHRLAAVSGEAGPAEGHSPGRRSLLAHLSEALDQRRPLLYRRGGGEGGGPATAPLALGLREWFDPAVSLCLPLIDGEGIALVFKQV